MTIDGVQTRREYVGRLPEVLEWVNQGARHVSSLFLSWDATPDLAQATWEWPDVPDSEETAWNATRDMAYELHP